MDGYFILISPFLSGNMKNQTEKNVIDVASHQHGGEELNEKIYAAIHSEWIRRTRKAKYILPCILTRHAGAIR